MEMDSLNKGKKFQEKAEKLFELEELKEAIRYYTKSEQEYRNHYPTPGDRIYFTQVNILQCLEYQLDDYPSVQGRYLKKNSEFFNEWDRTKIKKNISPSRQEEALDSYFNRKAAIKTQNIFKQVNYEVKKGKIDEAENLLDAIIEHTNVINSEEKDAIIAIAKAKKSIIRANAEKDKRRYDRDLRKIAALYHQAAGNLELPVNTSSKQVKHINALRYLNLSYYHKWVAIRELIKMETSKKPVRDHLEVAYKHYSKALIYAEREKNENIDSIRPLHVPIMNYKTSIVELRLFLFEYMKTGEQETFDRVFEAWERALEIVEETLIENDNEEESFIDESLFFEGFYYSLGDFRAEEYFLLAAKFFRLRNWKESNKNFNEWLLHLPDYHKWSWRYLNIYLRMLGTQIIERLESNSEKADVIQIIKKQNKIIDNELVGGAARYFGSLSQSLINKADNRQEVFKELDRYFPLDAQAISYGNIDKSKILDTLPPRIKRELSIPPGHTTYQLTQCSISFSSALESILGYIQDYGASWSDKPAVDSSEGLNKISNAICYEENWAENTIWEEKIHEVINIADSLKLSHQNEFFEKYEEAKELILDIVKPFMPLVVELEKEIRTTSIETVKPIWSIERSLGKTEESNSILTDIRVRVEKKYDLPIRPGLYYLPPNYRPGNRFYYSIDSQDNQPLYPIRFKPRWDYWEEQKLNVARVSNELLKVNSINSAIKRLEELIESKVNDESMYQELFMENPWFFGGKYSKIERHTKLDDENIPDFTGIRAQDNFRDIFELKPPFMKCFRSDDGYTADFNNAWSQVERYLEFTQVHQYYLREKGLNFENPRCFLLLGNDLTSVQRKSLRRREKLTPSIGVYTYQEIISIAKNFAKIRMDLKIR